MNATRHPPKRKAHGPARGQSLPNMNDTALDLAAIPAGSILGICYSGMHDTSIALVSPTGEPVFATSLERLSRVKQDGRWPLRLLEGLPWERIDKVALSVSEQLSTEPPSLSKAHPLPFAEPLHLHLAHGPQFMQGLASIPVPIEHVPHHLSHAASSFWGSGFDEALCLVYDGGMSNEDVFGGLYSAHVGRGIQAVDRFCCELQANITHLYSAVTAVLGFTPQKHEGKITGLAAYGRVDPACEAVMHQLLAGGQELNGLFSWANLYSDATPPELIANPARVAHLQRRLSAFTREDIAATVQHMTEAHVLELLRRAAAQGWASGAICLSGGLFANVKVNQRVAESGFDRFFVAPAMTDDGTALGAAWQLHAARAPGFRLPGPPSMYLGACNGAVAAREAVERQGVRCTPVDDPARELAERLAAGQIVAVFQGAGEFGPRALCNRTILAPAGDRSINDSLNQRLSRTEFMPFAPVVRAEDAAACFDLLPSTLDACAFMTVTVPCTPRMAAESPAVVHVDGTARPQLVHSDANPLAHAILSRYAEATSRLALVNTSFNVHEEPIVGGVDDALRGFFEAGLDLLYIEHVGLVDRRDNMDVENRYLREKLAAQAARLKARGRTRTPATATDEPAGATLASGPALSPYLMEGFHPPEAWGAWSSGRHARVVAPLDRSGRETVEVHISLSLSVYEGLLVNAPVLSIVVDGVQIGFALFRPHGPKAHDISFCIQSRRDACIIDLDLSDIGSPRWLDPATGTDDRDLGFALHRLAVVTSVAGNVDTAPRSAESAPTFWGA